MTIKLFSKSPRILFALWILVSGSTALARESPRKPVDVKGKDRIVVLPVAFYTPETKIAGGVAGILTFHRADEGVLSRPSFLSLYAVYTQMSQFTTKWEPTIYLNSEKILITGKLSAEKYPDRFWGIGNEAPDAAEEKYTPQTTSIEFSLQRRLIPRIVRTVPGGALSGSSIGGSAGGLTTGVGFIVNWDNRDSMFFPTRGEYFQVTMGFNRKTFGGDFDYTTLKVNLRRYFPVFGRHVLALQGVVQTASGLPPFYKYPSIGGDSMMRGYFSGRYRDKLLTAVQAEYRLPVFGRIGFAGFAGLGQVAPGLRDLRWGGFKPSLGLGLRFKVVPEEGTNIRLDFAFGKNTTGLYITANEAF
ncbi:MAG: BamA/TamA family outer membrane protein [Candidatus Aminicenantales bacterium]